MELLLQYFITGHGFRFPQEMPLEWFDYDTNTVIFYGDDALAAKELFTFGGTYDFENSTYSIDRDAFNYLVNYFGLDTTCIIHSIELKHYD